MKTCMCFILGIPLALHPYVYVPIDISVEMPDKKHRMKEG